MRRVSFFIDERLDDALIALQKRDGVPKAESIRRAIARYIDDKGIVSQDTKGGKQKRTKRP